MKPTHWTVCIGLAVAALVTAPLAFSAARAGTSVVASHDEGKEEGGLEDAMHGLNNGMKRLGKAFENKDLETVVKTAVEMQKAVNAGKTETPAKANDISDAKAKAEFVLGFRKQLIALEKSLLDLELAALDGKADDAKKIFNESIAPMKKSGHAKYKD